MSVIYISRLERFFRIAAELEFDKEDLRRHTEFVHRKTHDLLLRAEATANANGRDVIEAIDLPAPRLRRERPGKFAADRGRTQLRPRALLKDHRPEGKAPAW